MRAGGAVGVRGGRVMEGVEGERAVSVVVVVWVWVWVRRLRVEMTRMRVKSMVVGGFEGVCLWEMRYFPGGVSDSERHDGEG